MIFLLTGFSFISLPYYCPFKKKKVNLLSIMINTLLKFYQIQVNIIIDLLIYIDLILLKMLTIVFFFLFYIYIYKKKN